MVQKRPAAAHHGAAKKHKPDPVAQHCAKVSAGLQEAVEADAVPELVVHMLTSMLPDSLAVEKDTRHTYQESVAEMICTALATTEATLKQMLSDAQAAVDGGAEAKTTREAATKEAEENLKACEEEAQAKKLALAEAAAAFKKGKENVREAEGAAMLAEAELKQAAEKKLLLEGALKDMVDPLSEGTVPEEDVAGMVATLKGRLAKFNLVESLMTALPTALGKPPGSRGSFDTMVVGEVREEIGKIIDPLSAAISQSDSLIKERAAAQSAAEAALEEAKNGQLAAAAAYRSAEEALKGAKHGLKEAEHSLKQLGPESKRNLRALDAAQGTLEVFQSGALASAHELKERVAPPPEPEPAPEAPAADEAPAGEGGAEAAEAAAPTDAAEPPAAAELPAAAAA